MSQFLDFTDPWIALGDWMAEAVASEPRVPDAMQVATVDEDGFPSLRTVLLKEFGPDNGLVFYTNLGSQKGRELDATPRAAILLHWKSLERQVRASGPVRPVDEAAADAYFASRPRGSQIGAWASRQSEALDDRATLAGRVAETEARFAGRAVPRPSFWSGYSLHPQRFEFWQGREDRLHDRLVLARTDAGWHRERLYP